ncbi:DNA repair protein RecO [Salibacterium salarium]|uniref:DNA repair protein RecO n=1 Tax=Salibacterium salarium TaxID=284579 RepID=A0A3R9QHR7_9BACI|nr:DNA repair protein RecO [Salibacterium salarium]RSL30897.1 DNA repair protein RecO [Salibacterium salarium]
MLEKAEGIVLRTVAYGETNNILRLFTREAGKIAVMARGAKKPKSRLAAVSQPFVYATFLYYKSRGMKTLNQGDAIDSFRIIRNDLIRTAYASYILELLDKLTEEEEKNPYLFELMLQLLERMNDDDDPEVLVRIFETKMTAQAGIKPELEQCVHCQSKEGTFSFSVKEAGFLCHRCTAVDDNRLDIHPKTVQLLRTFFHLDIARFGSISLKDETKQELRTILDTYYQEYSGLHLKSKRFIEQMEKW